MHLTTRQVTLSTHTQTGTSTRHDLTSRRTNHNLDSEPLILSVHSTAYRVVRIALDMAAAENAATSTTLSALTDTLNTLTDRCLYTMASLADNPDCTTHNADLEHLKTEANRLLLQLPDYHDLLDRPLRGTRVQFFDALTI